VSKEVNVVYPGVRQLFKLLELDRGNYGTKAWNPLGNLVKPGTTVLLKPNFVLSRHAGGKDVYSIITHPSVLRAVADFCWIALKGQGRIIVADSPQYDCNFEELMATTRLDAVRDFYKTFKGPSVDICDLRDYWSRWKHFPSLLETLPGDPKGSMVVNLGRKSALSGKPHPENLYGAVYHRAETIARHTGETQEYQLSKTVMDADVVISVPKLKVHKKVGVTLNVKGLVGIATNKNFLVHYSLTPPSRGGDQYPDGLFTKTEEKLIRTERWMYDRLLAPKKRGLEYLHRLVYWLHNHTTRKLGLKVDERKRMLDAGNWHGNDSAWRMAVDLFKAFLFSDKEGKLQATPQRRTFSIVDGVIGGENNGPLMPDSMPAGVLLGGENYLAVDLVATRLMGFDPLKVRMYADLLANREVDFGVHSFADIHVSADDPALINCLSDRTSPFLNFKPHPGWLGHIEVR
jgi:uncharacterized protein (DUF362 family)